MRDAHPLIGFGYFVVVISLTMCASHPVLAALALGVALLYLLLLKGPLATLRLLGMACAVLAVVTGFNMLFVHRGMTVVLYLLKNPVTLEAILYGLSLGLMLSAVLLWFMCYQEVVGTDRFLALFSWAAPTTVMMVSMIFSYIPQVTQKSRQIDDAYKAMAYVDKGEPLPADGVATPAAGDPPAGLAAPAADAPAAPDTPAPDLIPTSIGLDGRPVEASTGPEWLQPEKPMRRVPPMQRLRWPVRLSSILMGWSMESGLATAASMRARAYGSARRSSYLPLRWSLRDSVLLGCMAALAAGAIAAEVRLLDGFLFYPRMTPLAFSWLYAPFVAFAAWPIAYELGIRLKWRLARF